MSRVSITKASARLPQPTRRRKRDGVATRSAIVEAALAVFSTYGYEGSSIDKIAELSGTSRGLILHHFTSKPDLWKAVQAELIRRFDEAYGGLEETGPATLEFLRRFLRTYLRYFRNDRRLLQLGLWTQAQGEVTAWPGEERILPGVVALVEGCQKAGVVRRDVGTMNIVIAMCGMIYFWILNRNRFHSSAGIPLDEAGTDDAFIEDVLRLILTDASAEPPANAGS